MATIRKRGDGWFVQIRRKGYAPQFKTLSSKAEAQAWAREQESLIDRRQAPTDLKCLRSLTLGDILRRYKDTITPRKRSADSEDLRLGKMLRAPMSAVTLAELGVPTLAAYRDDRMRVAKAGTVRRELYWEHFYAPSTANRPVSLPFFLSG